jgi:DNA-nicking Smr family endonuclease
LQESLHGTIGLEDRLEGGDEAQFLRPGVARQTLRDLRRGRWVIEAELDLHGGTRDAARIWLVDFLAECRRRDRRIVRIIHGRGLGSPGKTGVLKTLVRGWLAQRDEVLAYCQAKPHDGGEGALLVLLKAARPANER